MALPWLIGAAVVGLGVAIKKALEDDDTSDEQDTDEDERRKQQQEAKTKRKRAQLKQKVSNLEAQLKTAFPEQFAQAAQALELPSYKTLLDADAIAMKLKETLRNTNATSNSSYAEAVTEILEFGKAADHETESLKEKFGANLLILESMRGQRFDLEDADTAAFCHFRESAARLKKYFSMKENLLRND